MKVYYSASKASIVVGTAKQVYPPASLEARADGDLITIWPPDGLQPVLSASYASITDQLDNGFASAADALTYLQGQFQQKPYSNTNDFDPGDLAAYFTSL